MVPHHHHDGVLIPVEESSCPAHHDHHEEQPKEHQEHPLHCHAFNEITFYKNVLPGVSQPSELPVLFAKRPSPEENTCNPGVAKRLTIIRSVSFLSRHDSEQISLRGPPPVV
jgi:hypothetical protein